jgi:hypothetical protein
MIETTSVRVNCPYCGLENKVTAEKYPPWWATCCDGEIGGCEKIFIYKVIVEVRGLTRKIVGEE